MENSNEEDFIIPGETPVGRCSICGGIVIVPTFWASIIPAVPTCKNCGATKKTEEYSYVKLPVVDMIPMQRIKISTKNTNNI